MTSTSLVRVPTVSVVASPDQNREVFDPVELAELAESIRETGLLQPIKVRADGTTFVLVAGERRLRACRDILGWSDIDAIVSDGPADESAALGTLAENMVRSDPGPLEEARGLAAVMSRYSLTPGELAKKLGKRSQWIAGRLALLDLADDVAHFVQAGTLPIGRAVLMSGLDANRQRLALQAHERNITTDAFRVLVARFADDQAAECMFDPDAFLALEEYVVEAEKLVEAEESPVIQIRENPLGMVEIAQLLEVKRTTPQTWRARGLLPEPDGYVSDTPFWFRDTIMEWATATNRLPEMCGLTNPAGSASAPRQTPGGTSETRASSPEGP